MHIGIIGATGNTGTFVVEAGLARNLSLTLLVRSVEKVPSEIQARVGLIQGDATNPQALEQLVGSTDSIISVIGHTPTSDTRVQTQLMKNLVMLLPRHRRSRLVSLTGIAVAWDKDSASPLHSLINLAVSRVDPERIADGREHAQVLQQSSTNWTIIRTPLQLSKVSSSKPQIGTLGFGSGPWIARNHLANLLIDCALDQTLHSGEMPVISQWW